MINEDRLTFRRWLLVLPLLGLGAALADDYVFVALNQATVQDQPAYFSTKLADVKEGDRLRLTQLSNGWAAVVLTDGRAGFIRETAVRTKAQNRDWSRVMGQPDSARDTYAAGKGFSPEVEEQYKKDTKLDYGPVDRMIAKPSYPHPLDQLKKFREEGGLGEFAGGR